MRRAAFWIVFLVVLLAGIMALTQGYSGQSRRRPSALNRHAWGLRATFVFLEGRGWDVSAWRRPLTELEPPPGCLVIAAPVLAPPTPTEIVALETWMARGGQVVLLTAPGRLESADLRLYRGLDLAERASGERIPLRWSAWQSWRLAEDVLTASPESPFEIGSDVRVQRGKSPLNRPSDARVWFDDSRGLPAVWAQQRDEGRLVVVENATLWGNGWISRGSNARFVESLLEELGGRGTRIFFAEWLHGERDLSQQAGGPFGTPFAMLLIHLGLIYAGVVWSVSRRFGPRLGREPPRSGDTRAWIAGLAEVHAKLRHAEAAGRTMTMYAARRAGSSSELPPALATRCGDDGDLVRHGRAFAEWYRERRAAWRRAGDDPATGEDGKR